MVAVWQKRCALLFIMKSIVVITDSVFFLCVEKLSGEKYKKKYSADNTKLEADGVR